MLHDAEYWKGPRCVLSFILMKNVYDHFAQYGKKIYAMMEELDFPAKLELIVGQEVEVKGKLIEVWEKEGEGYTITMEECEKPE